MSYGHGIAVSLMQMARAYTVFAHDGELMPLSLIKIDDVRRMRGCSRRRPCAKCAPCWKWRPARGHGAQGARAGYRVGGKTGTAYKVEGGVYARKYVASFVGIAPISDPRLVVAVMIDEPTSGATTAATSPVRPSRRSPAVPCAPWASAGCADSGGRSRGGKGKL
jgi:cell division protein FtsI (penicillin-binding protein 3)